MASEFRLNHISLLVRSLDRSVAFYRDVLGLPEIACGARLANIRWFGLGPSQSIHLIEGDVGATLVTITTHFCMTAGDFDGTLLHLRDQRVAFCNVAGEAGREHVRADGVRSVYLQDPDGYWIEISEEF